MLKKVVKKVLKIVISTEKSGRGANFTQKSTQKSAQKENTQKNFTQKCAQKENTQRKLDCSKKSGKYFAQKIM